MICMSVSRPRNILSPGTSNATSTFSLSLGLADILQERGITGSVSSQSSSSTSPVRFRYLFTDGLAGSGGTYTTSDSASPIPSISIFPSEGLKWWCRCQMNAFNSMVGQLSICSSCMANTSQKIKLCASTVQLLVQLYYLVPSILFTCMKQLESTKYIFCPFRMTNLSLIHCILICSVFAV